MSTVLPDGFQALEPYVEQWAKRDFQARFEARYTSDMEAIAAFYDAVTPLADQALGELERQDLGNMSPQYEALYRLVMALAHDAVAVERYRQPRPDGVTWPTTLTVVKGSTPQ